jgi:hypothetical protein
MHFDFVIPVMDPESEMPFLGGVTRALERDGASVALISMTRTPHEACLAVTPNVFSAYADFDPSRSVDAAEMSGLERRYRLGSIDDHVAPERYYDWGSRDYTRLYQATAHAFHFIESFLSRHTASAFMNCIGGEIMRRSMARVADVGGPANLILDWTPLPGRIVVTTKETGWDELHAPPPPCTANEAQIAEDFVRQLTTKRTMYAAPSTLGLEWKHIRRAGKRIFEERKVGVSLTRLSIERAQRAARRLTSSHLYRAPDWTDRFFFFPLHQPNDSALTLRAPQFMEQEALIAFIAERLLPFGTKLYVKPHVGARDAYATSTLTRIARTRGVRLIEPTVNSHELIQRADAILVINSTVGFESICHGRPTVVFGRPFYRGFGITADVDRLDDALDAIDAARSSPPNRDLLIRFIASCYRASAPGLFSETSDENVQHVARAIAEKYARLEHRERPVSATPHANA